MSHLLRTSGRTGSCKSRCVIILEPWSKKIPYHHENTNPEYKSLILLNVSQILFNFIERRYINLLSCLYNFIFLRGSNYYSF